MEKKWVYNIGLVLLILGALLFTISATSTFIINFLEQYHGVPLGTYDGYVVNYLSDGFMALVIGLLLVGFNKVLNKLDEMHKQKNDDMV